MLRPHPEPLKLPSDGSRLEGSLPFALLSILGLSFWFLLAFPFANHNESYAWLSHLDQAEVQDVILRRMQPVVTYRPIAMVIAWLGYRLSGGSIYPIELLNYVLASAAWLLLSTTVTERRGFALVALLIQGVFFSGYIYLFHLHGVFYSPLLLQLALLFHYHQRHWSAWTISGTSVLAAVLSLVHPFSLLIQLAFLAGLLLERRGSMNRPAWLAAASAALALVVLAKLEGGDGTLPFGQRLDGLVISYRMLEVNLVVSGCAVLMMALTLLGSRTGWDAKVLSVASVLLAAGCLSTETPLIVAWLLLCMLRLVLQASWSTAAVLAATALFPIFTATGSPTYGIFALMACSVGMTQSAFRLEAWLSRMRARHAATLCVLALLLAVLLRSGTPVPVLSRLINPLLAEKERTFQLEQVLTLLEGSGYAGCGLLLGQESGPPSKSSNALRRERRPPTEQQYLDAYLAARHHVPCAAAGAPRPIIYFGGERRGDARLLYTLPGVYAGSVNVQLPEP